MFAKDLRIGNYVYEATGTIQEIDAISYELVSFKNSGTARFEVIRPIPLTEDILLKFGLEIVPPLNYWTNHDYLRFFLDEENRLHCSIGDDDYGTLYALIKYVHEFQNLMYTLTHKEINI